jgi:hypothetical protein
MKTKQVIQLAIGAIGAAALIGSALGASVASPGGTTFTDGNADSLIDDMSESGAGSPADRFSFDVDILGPGACIVINPFEAGNTAGTALYNSSIALAIGILNSTGLGWQSVDFQLYTDDACTDVSPDTDQWSFAQNEAVGPVGTNNRDPDLSVGNTLTTLDGIDRMEFELDSPLASGASLTAFLTLTNGSVLGTINPPFSMRIIPEPSAVALLGLGVLGFFFRRRRA